QGYKVDVRGKPYDLHCTRADNTLHVEVKGTTTTGEEILLTPNEVTFAEEHSSSMALFVVSGIQVSEGDNPVASGGTAIEVRPWRIDSSRLTAICYSYVAPHGATAGCGH